MKTHLLRRTNIAPARWPATLERRRRRRSLAKHLRFQIFLHFQTSFFVVKTNPNLDFQKKTTHKSGSRVQVSKISNKT